MVYDVDIMPLWDGDNLSCLEYIPWYSGNSHPSTHLLLDFKNKLPHAVEQVKAVAIQTLAMSEDDLAEYRCRFLVSVPSSSSERANTPCEDVCSEIAKHFPHLVHLKGALKRTITVPKSATSPPGERPTYTRHMQTIQYVGPRLRIPDGAIIMVDDIITRGETSRACRDILKQATHCKYVLGLFMGRTTRR